MSEETAKTKSSSGRYIWSAVCVLVIAVSAWTLYLVMTGGREHPSKVRLALVTSSQGAYWDPVLKGAEDAAQEWNVDLTVVRSKPDADAQAQSVRELLAKGVDGLAISPRDPDGQAALLNEAASKTALITFDSDAAWSKRRVFVGTDDYAAGQLAAAEVRDALPEGGAVLVTLSGLGSANVRDRRQGLIDDLVDRPSKRDRTPDPADAPVKGEKYSVLTVLDGGDPAKATALVAEALKAHPEVKGVVGVYGAAAPAILAAVEQAGLSGKVKIVGFDDLPETVAGIESGKIFSSILQDQYRCGYETVRILAGAARGIDQRGPLGPRLTHVGIQVMRAANLPTLRAQRRIGAAAAPTTAAS